MMLYCNDELTVTQITEKLKLSRPAVSHHLKLLLDSGLVTVNQVGKERYYKIHLTDLINLMRNLADTLDKKQ